MRGRGRRRKETHDLYTTSGSVAIQYNICVWIYRLLLSSVPSIFSLKIVTDVSCRLYIHSCKAANLVVM